MRKNKSSNGIIALIVMLLISLLMLGVLIALVLRPGIEAKKDASVTTEPSQTTAETTEVVPTETEPPFVPEIYPNTVGLYIPAGDGTKDRVKVTEFTSNWTAKKDIDCFEAFASAETRITGTRFADMWKTSWDSHENGQNGKLGYILSFTCSDGTSATHVIRKPSDADSFKEYIEVYLYDDINQVPGVRYTHLSDSEITADTIISSIKLTCGSKIDEVKDITLTAFIYNGEDCFDSDGAYIGQVKASVSIKEGE